MTEIVCGAKGVTPKALEIFMQETARVVATAPKHWAKPVLAIQLDGCMTVRIEINGLHRTHKPTKTRGISGGDGLYSGGTVEAMHLVANATAVRLFNDICEAKDADNLSRSVQQIFSVPALQGEARRRAAVAADKAKRGARTPDMPTTHSKTKKA